jgi:hypothetical protein
MGTMKRYPLAAPSKRTAAERREHALNARAVRNRYQRAANGLPEAQRAEPTHCELCGDAPRQRGLASDHDHLTGHWRGWLCTRCNAGLGMFRDSPELLGRAILYLLGKRTD